jgi:hypothetical protein
MITRYEISATKNGKTFFVAFTERRTARCLVSNVRHYGYQIALAIGADEEAVCVKSDKNEVVMSDGTRVFYTGRTELDIATAA